jgi:TonB family protein
MAVNYTPGRTNFGPLPEPERSPGSFIASMVVNATIMGVVIFVIGATANKAIQAHRYEETILIVPTTPPPPPPPKVKMPDPPKVDPVVQPKLPEVKLEAPKIKVVKPEPKPEDKPIEMEAKVALPEFKTITPKVKEAPQPKAAIAPTAMPAQSTDVKNSAKPVHLGDTFGVTPNPNATRPATISAIGNPYGGQQGPAVAPHGVVGSTGIGGTRSGSGGTGGAYAGSKVASAAIPTQAAVTPVQQQQAVTARTIPIEVISKPPVQYTAEARQLRIEGDVVLRVTFTATGQVIVQSVVHGLGHGLDEEARRVAQQIRFHPATRNGQAVDSTTTITITFQLA